MSLRQTLLLIVITLLAGLGAAVFMHPRGADGVRDLLGIGKIWEAQSPATGGASDPVINKAQTTANQLRYGDEAYDAGNFDGALTFYSIAIISDDATQRSAAQRGLARAVLAWAVVQDAPAPNFGGRTGDERYAELLGRASTEQTEQAWLDTVLFAAGAKRVADLPGAVDTLFEVVRTAGPVETRLQNVLRNGTRNAKNLTTAMTAIGLDHGGSGGMLAGLEHEDDASAGGARSGIGFTNKTAPSYRIPFGEFPNSFRPKLEEAAKAEFEGLQHAEDAGPDGDDRPAHRREALRLLRIARDIYNEALEIDPESSDVQRHLKQVNIAYSRVRKSATFPD
jgi:hypothetical protein